MVDMRKPILFHHEILMTFNRFTKSLKQRLFVLAVVLSSQSAIAASDWQINPIGSGASAASLVSSLNVGGVGYVQLLPTDTGNPYAFTFIENGAYRILNAERSAPFGANDLTATYSVIGTGSFLDQSALRMFGGRINLYADPIFDFATSTANYGSDNGKLVASFNIFDGYAVNNQGMVTVKATGIAGSFSQGYLYTANGTDMASLSNVQLELNITNAGSMPDDLINSEIICGLAAACGGGSVSQSFPGFTVQDSGSVSISAVPEPETAAMLLAGLGFIIGIAHRRQKFAR